MSSHQRGTTHSLIDHHPFAVLQRAFRCSDESYSQLPENEFPVLSAGNLLLHARYSAGFARITPQNHPSEIVKFPVNTRRTGKTGRDWLLATARTSTHISVFIFNFP